MRLSFLSLPLVLAACAHAEPPAQPDIDPMMLPADLSTPVASVRSMMRAMYQGDADMVDQVFLEGAELRRVSGDGEIRPNALPRWRDWVATLSPGQAHEELFSMTSHQFGNLATVWAPFVIRVDDAIVGCGVNTLTLAKTDGDWRVIFCMDTGEPADTCDDFKARYTAAN